MVNRFLDPLEESIITSLIGAATRSSSSPSCTGTPPASPIPAVQDCSSRSTSRGRRSSRIYMFVWMAKFGAAYGVRTGIHVGVDVMINRANDRRPRLVRPVRPDGRRALHAHRRQLRRAPSSGSDRHTIRCRPTSNCRSGSSTRASRLARTSCASASCSPRGPSMHRRAAARRPHAPRLQGRETKTDRVSTLPSPTCTRAQAGSAGMTGLVIFDCCSR